MSQTHADTSQSPVVGYPGLDPHGRVKDLHFKNAAGTNATLQRFEYGHDPLDQRVFAKVTQRSSTGAPVENERSYLYGYDRLGRLVGAKHGALNNDNTDIGASASVPVVRDSQWTMDLLGNWVGDSQTSTPGRRTLGVPQTTGPPYHREVSFTDTVNRTNAITQRAVVEGTGTPVNTAIVHDKAGNLVLDGEYLYQYDAWNRLALISARGTLIAAAGSNGNVVWSGSAGPWIAHYTYDGLGRLIRKQSPWPVLDPWNRPQVRTERFYYDGVRRIQEVVTDPLPMDGVNPVNIEEEMGGVPPLATTSATTREYIHSPGYVDEVVAQVEISAAAGSGHGADRPAWVTQDANYNLVGLVGDDGTFLHQYTWDPYGEPVAIERYDTGTGGAPQPFENRIGHQGLFFDRLDGGAGNVLLPQLWVDAGTGLAAKGLYQNRNRSYSPGLGRFVQRDPDGAALPVLSSLSRMGRPAPASPLSFASPIQAHPSDGPHFYSYQASRPVSASDPSGLMIGLIGPANVSELQSEHMQNVMEGGGNAILAVLNLSAEYSGRMDAGYVWAKDMALDDDLLAPVRTWQRRLVGASRNTAKEQWIFAGRKSTARRVMQGASIGGKARVGQVNDSYSEARRAAREAGLTVDAHHIVEARHLKNWEVSTNGPAVLLTKSQHQVITNKLSRALPYGERFTVEQVERGYRKAYEDYPELLDRALSHIRGLR